MAGTIAEPKRRDPRMEGVGGKPPGEMRSKAFGVGLRRGLSVAETRKPLGMDPFLVAPGAVDLEAQCIVAVRQQRDLQQAARFDAQVVIQCDSLETQGTRGEIVGIGLGNGGARHLQAQQCRQALSAVTVGDEDALVALQFDAVGGIAQGRGISLEQGMPCDRTRPLAERALRRDPVALARERIGRQRHADRTGIAVQPRPIDVHTLRPVLGDPRQITAREPVITARGETGVGPAGREEFAMPADAALLRLRIDRPAIRKRLQLVAQVVDRIDLQHDALVHRLATDLQRIGERTRIGLVSLATQESGQLADLLLQLVRGARRERHQPRAVVLPARAVAQRRFLHDQMRVGATGAERGNPGDARDFAPRLDRPPPGAEFALQTERRGLEIDLLVDLCHVQGRHQLAMTQLQQDLGQSGDARCGLAVADVGFQRTDRAMRAARRVRMTALAEGTGEPRDLDRIAQRGTCAVRFEIADVGRIDAGTRQCGRDHLGLGDRIRHGVAVGSATGIEGAGLDHRMDVVAVAQRMRQRLEDDRTDAFGIDEPVGVPAEGAAFRAFRQHAERGQLDHVLRVDDQADAAGDRGIAQPTIQAVECKVDCGQR